MTAILEHPPAPPQPPYEPETGPSLPASGALVAVAAAVGVVCDLALRSGGASLGGTLLVVATSAAVLGSGRLRTRESRVLVGVAPAFGVWLALRTSAWLLPLDVLAAGGLLVLGTSLSSGGSLFDLTIPGAAQRAVRAAADGLRVPAFVRPIVPSGARLGSAAPLARGVALALPVLFLLGGLLASADAVFASFFSLDIDGGNLSLHALLVLLGGWTLLGLLRTASCAPAHDLEGTTARLGRTELTVLLGSVATLFAAFAGAQVVALSAGGQKVLDTRGLTYAEYARSGFFQLLCVATLTIGLLLGVRALVDREDAEGRRRVRSLGLVVVALTLVIVVVAVRRLGLYQEAFGLTMLRLYSTLFALWVGLVVIALGATLAGIGGRRSWLPGAAAVSGLALLFALNVVNPEAVVAHYNVQRLTDGREVDSEYLAEGLSLDAVPTIVHLLPNLDDATRADLLARIGCPRRGDGWSGWNASRSAAAAAVADHCAAGGQ